MNKSLSFAEELFPEEMECRYIAMANHAAYAVNSQGRITSPRAAHFAESIGALGLSRMNGHERRYILERIGDGDAVLEVGTFHGASTAYWAKRKPDAFFVSIDDYVSHKDCSLLAACANQRSNIMLLVGKSAALARMNFDKSFDLIFIDGDHTMKGCLADLRMCASLAKNSGVIICHDYYPDDVGRVADAVKEFDGEEGWNVVRIYQHLAILEKRIP